MNSYKFIQLTKKGSLSPKVAPPNPLSSCRVKGNVIALIYHPRVICSSSGRTIELDASLIRRSLQRAYFKNKTEKSFPHPIEQVKVQLDTRGCFVLFLFFSPTCAEGI